MTYRVVTPDAGVELRALVGRGARLADDGMGEDAVTTVEPAIGAPDEGVERFVGVLPAPAVEEHLRLTVGDVVAVGVGNEEEVGGRTDPHAAETDREATDEVQALLEHLAGIEPMVAVGILEDQDPIAGLLRCDALRIGIGLGDPQSPAVVEAHRDRLADIRLGGEELHRETGGRRHRLGRFLRLEAVGHWAALSRLGLLMTGDRHLLARLRVNEDSLFVGDDKVGQAVAGRIGRGHLNADAGVVVDELRDELRLAGGGTGAAEPIEHRRGRRLRITVGTVGPESLAGDDVVEAVAVDIGDVDGVDLGEDGAVRAVGGFLTGDRPVVERPAAVGALLLLPPTQAVAMGGETRDHVVESVAIDVANVHLGAPGAGEGDGVEGPQRVAGKRRGLLPPAVLLEDVRLAVAVDITNAHAVREPATGHFPRDPVEDPGLRRIVLPDRGIAEKPTDRADDLGREVAIEIGERRRLVVDLREDAVAWPWPLVPLGVLEPRRILSRKAVDEDVVPAVAVEVVAPAEEVVGVTAGVERLRRVDLVTLGEGGAGKPPWPGGDVGDAVFVEVAHPGPLGDEAAVEFVPGERDHRQRRLCGVVRRRGPEQTVVRSLPAGEDRDEEKCGPGETAWSDGAWHGW